MAADEDPFESTRMTLGEHLDELRKRLFRGVLAILVTFLIGWAFHLQVSTFVLRPMHTTLDWIDQDQVEKYEAELAANPEVPRSTYFTSDDPANTELKDDYTVSRRGVALGYGEGFWFALKITFFFALFLGSPILLWEMWQFVAAGLYEKERRVVMGFFPFSIGLFVAGVSFGFFVMVPYGFYFLATTFPPEDVIFMPRLTDYLGLLTTLTLSLGVIFQLPLIMNALVRIDVIRPDTLAKFRPHCVVGAFILSAILTPPDPVTQLLLAGPVVVLFEIGLFTSRWKAPAPVEVAT